MADHVVVPARNLVALGDVDPVHAAPLTDAGMTALHAVERGRPLLEPGATAVVVGVGGLGHLAVQFLRATSDARVLAVDVDRARLDFAAELGADDGVLSGPDAAEGVLTANAGRKVDVVYDFVGAQESLDLAAADHRPRRRDRRDRRRRRAAVDHREDGAGRAPDREIAMVHTFGGSRGDLVRALALAEEAWSARTSRSTSSRPPAEVLADLDAGKVLGRAVLVP